MLRNAVITLIVGILCVGVFGGCSKKTEQPPAQQEQVKTAAEYKAEADQEITEQNMDDELDKLEKDIDADAKTVDANQT